MADYRLQQTGEVIQERLNQIPLNASDIQQLQSEVTKFLNTQQVQQLISNALMGYSTTQEVAAAIGLKNVNAEHLLSSRLSLRRWCLIRLLRR